MVSSTKLARTHEAFHCGNLRWLLFASNLAVFVSEMAIIVNNMRYINYIFEYFRSIQQQFRINVNTIVTFVFYLYRHFVEGFLIQILFLI